MDVIDWTLFMHDQTKLNDLINQYTGKISDDLLHQVGHDIRAQLNNIIGNMQLIKLSLISDDFTDEERDTFIAEVIGAARVIDVIVEAALKTSQ
ncbi:MAG: hypothetical protein Kow00117_15370 [Phototrophicales bacterium]